MNSNLSPDSCTRENGVSMWAGGRDISGIFALWQKNEISGSFVIENRKPIEVSGFMSVGIGQVRVFDVKVYSSVEFIPYLVTLYIHRLISAYLQTL